MEPPVFIPLENLAELRRGDIISHHDTGLEYVVMHVHGEEIYATRTILVTNPMEWSLLHTSWRREEDA